MKLSATNSARIIGWLAGLIIAMVTLGIPLGYYVVSYQYMLGSIETEAEINANEVSGIINANPEFWEFEKVRLAEKLSHRPKAGYQEARRLMNAKDAVVAESADTITPPIVTRAHEVLDSGIIVGRIEISRSFRPLLKRTGLLALFMLPVGLGVFIALYVLPIRVIRRTEGALVKTNRDLQMEISARKRSENEIRRLNEELELKVAERTSQLYEAQEALVRKEKLAFLGLIAGNMGNELRNPLGIMNNAVFFMKTVMPDADENIKEYLDIIKNEIDNSQRIISDLLDFYRSNTFLMKLVPVHELIRQGLEKSAIPENIQLQADLPEMLPAVKVDPLQMERVLKNLISNAVHAMPEGGELRIAARLMRDEGRETREEGVLRPSEQSERSSIVSREQGGRPSSIEISVTDTGKGIAPEHMDKLFQPLFSTKSRGIGLGLALSKKLTEANGGRIKGESRLGKGTTFTVILPTAGKGP